MKFEEASNHSTIPFAYRMAYLVNTYREPLLKRVEDDLKISRPEWTVLLCLSMKGGIIAKDIADLTGLARNSISRGIKSLDERRLIVRRPDTIDKRRTVLHLSERGAELFGQIIPWFEIREQAMLQGLNKSEQTQFFRLLDKLCDGVTDWSEIGSDITSREGERKRSVKA